MVCLYCLREIKNIEYLSAFYLDHGLRDEAKEEIILCQNICNNLKIDFFYKQKNIAELAKKLKLSLEDCGHVERYKSFYNQAKKHACNYIVTAHHFDDQIETVLMQIFAGKSFLRLGINASFKINNSISVVRPMLKIKKEDILSYAKKEKILFSHDSSNDCNNFQRNKIRNLFLPLLKKAYSSGILNGLQRLKDNSDNITNYVDSEVEKYSKIIKLPKNKFSRVKFKKIPEFIQNELIKNEFKKLNQKVSSDYIKELIKIINSNIPNKIFNYENNFSFFIEYNDFYFQQTIRPTKIESIFLKEGDNVILNKKICLKRKFILPKSIKEKSKNQVYLDLNKLNLETLYIKTRKLSDKFIPLNAPGSKSIKKILIDKKVPLSIRSTLLSIADKDGIIWLVGIEIADRVKITEKTNKFLEIKIRD